MTAAAPPPWLKGTGCSACNSPRVDEINAWLKEGRSELQAVKNFGVSRGAIRRHRAKGHVPPDVDDQTVPASPPEPGVDIDPVAALQKQLNELHSADTKGYSPARLDRHHDQMRRVAESLSRTRPPTDLEGPASRKLRVLEEMSRVQDEVLERFPEAREAVGEALVEWKRTRPQA